MCKHKLKSCMKTIQDKLRTRITTIRTLRDSRAVPYCAKKWANTQHMRDFGFCSMSNATHKHTHNIQCECDCAITIVIVKAETCHKHSKRKHQLFS